jgi:transglutaminase-like putative cysteine protease
MIKKLLLCSILSVLFLNLSAQEEKDYEKVKFGNVSVEEFNVKPGGRDSAASAVVLFKIGRMNFGLSRKGNWNYYLEVHKRIKIINKEGYDYANFSIPIYRSSNGEEDLNKVQIASYNLVNDKVIQNKASKDEKFADKYNKNNTVYKYTLSNIEPGTIVEIKYTIQSDFLYTLRDWYFQEGIPVVWSEFALTLPEYYRYNIYTQPFYPINLIRDESVNESFTGVVSDNNVYGSQSYDFKCVSSYRKWASKNIPSFKDESFIKTSDDFITKMIFEIQSEQFPNSPVQNYSTNWQKIAETYKKAEHFGSFLAPDNYSKKLVSEIVKDDATTLEKMAKIYGYVKSNIKWNKNYGDYSVQNNPKNVIETKTGNIGDINLTLLNLLQTANLDAKPLVLSTRSNGRHPGYPMSSKFNYVIAAVNIDSALYLLDASQPENTVNLVSYDALNHKGLVLDLDNLSADWLLMEPNEVSVSSIYTVLSFDDDLKLKGTITKRKSNYDALNTRRKFYSYASEEEFLKDFKSNKNGFNIKKYAKTDFDKPSLPLVEEIEFELEDYMEEAGNLVYFNPLMYDRTKENPFKDEERNFPVDFGYPFNESCRILITTPEGFEVDKLPESILFKLEDNKAVFSYTVSKLDNQVLINSKILISKSEFGAERYAELKELFKQVVAKQAQPVVYKKL